MKKEELDPSYTRPFIGTKKKYTVLPIYTFRRKMVPLTPSTWDLLLKFLKLPRHKNTGNTFFFFFFLFC